MRLDPIKPIFEQDGPFVTIYAEVGRAAADPAAQREARLTTVRHRLEHADVPSELAAELGRRLEENTHLPGAVRRTVVAAGDSVVFDDLQPGHSHWPELVEIGPLPELSGWLAHADTARKFLLVNADRVGADLSIHEALQGPPETTSSVQGEDFYITKVAEGDWAQKQFQQTAENNWRHNAGLVADEGRSLARRHATTATLVAGETRARAEVVRALEHHDPQVVAPVIEIESGGRGAGASTTALWEQVTQVVTRLQREADSELAAQLDEADGRGEGAAIELDQVLDALVQARVEHVLVDLADLTERTIAPSRLEGITLPSAARTAEQLPADRAVVAAAALTGASLTLLPKSMIHGSVAALLRWA